VERSRSAVAFAIRLFVSSLEIRQRKFWWMGTMEATANLQQRRPDLVKEKSSGDTGKILAAGRQHVSSMSAAEGSSAAEQVRLKMTKSAPTLEGEVPVTDEFEMKTRRKSLVEKTAAAYSESVQKVDRTGLPGKSGYLKKENRHGRWQKRYFVINNSHLNYYKNRHSEHGVPSATIDLRNATHICVLARNGIPGTKFAIQTRSAVKQEEECYFLRASSHKEAVSWVAALNGRRSYFLSKLGKSSDTICEDEEDLALESEFAEHEGNGPSQLLRSTSAAETVYYEPQITSPPVRSPSDDSNDGMDDYWIEGEDSDDEGFVSADEVPDDGASSVEDDDSDSKASLGFRKNNNECVVSESLAQNVANTPPPTLERSFWHVPECRKLQVRSKSYLTTSKKQAASPPVFELIAVDNFICKERVDHIASHPSNRIAQAIKRGDKFPFMFVVNFQVPGPPFYSFVMYMAATERMQHCLFSCSDESLSSVPISASQQAEALPEGYLELCRKFFLGESDAFCDERFKLIPRICEGPYIVRRAVGSKPAVLGKRLTQRYFRHSNYLELDLDIGSSVVAHKIVQLSIGFAKLLTVDMALVLEGKHEKELPEQVLGLVRVVHIDMAKAVTLQE